MSLLPFFEWCESTAIGTAIRESVWYFPVIESFHLVGLAVIGGAVLLVDLRLMGAVFPRIPVAQLARDARPWLIGSIALMLLTGIVLFLSEAVKCYYNTSFWVKMTALLLAIVFVFTIRQKVVTADEATTSPATRKLVAAVSITLWLVVAAAGRWIGFSG